MAMVVLAGEHLLPLKFHFEIGEQTGVPYT